ncbi:MAG: type II toxin-antitoxin system Phd/YefM family antitoxin, partial [Clostridiales bacterium]|nr:type II toxin-antitoxin system Phd/YefM family antitoxin [Clostridiales bacterium]
MPLIMPIKELRKTSELSELAHKEQKPIFITKNGYSDLVVMSSELFDRFA